MADESKKEALWVKVQQMAYTGWVDSTLKQAGDADGFSNISEIAEGVKLHRFLKLLKNNNADLGAMPAPPKDRIRQIDLLAKCLAFVRDELNVGGITASAENLVDHDLSQTLGMLHILFRKYRMAMLALQSESGVAAGKKGDAEGALVNWVAAVVEKQGVSGVTSFKSPGFSDGTVFAALVSAHTPLPYTAQQLAAMEPRERLKVAFDHAQNVLGVQRLLTEDEVADGSLDERSIALYTALLAHAVKMKEEKDVAATQKQTDAGILQDMNSKIKQLDEEKLKVQEEKQKAEEELAKKMAEVEQMQKKLQEEMQRAQAKESEAEEAKRKAIEETLAREEAQREAQVRAAQAEEAQRKAQEEIKAREQAEREALEKAAQADEARKKAEEAEAKRKEAVIQRDIKDSESRGGGFLGGQRKGPSDASPRDGEPPKSPKGWGFARPHSSKVNELAEQPIVAAPDEKKDLVSQLLEDLQAMSRIADSIYSNLSLEKETFTKGSPRMVELKRDLNEMFLQSQKIQVALRTQKSLATDPLSQTALITTFNSVLRAITKLAKTRRGIKLYSGSGTAKKLCEKLQASVTQIATDYKLTLEAPGKGEKDQEQTYPPLSFH